MKTLSNLCCIAVSTLILAPSHSMALNSIPSENKIGGFAVAVQAWTFRKFTVMEAIRKTSETGARAMELIPGQQVSADSDAKFDHNASPETIAKVKAELARHGIRAVNYGVVGAKGEAEWRKIFELAKTMGMHALTTESVDQLDIIEKLVKEFDIAVGIHNHPKRTDNPNYKVWDPNYVLSVIKDRDNRIGAAADNGHWATSGIKSEDGIRILAGRIISMHLKDRAEIGKGSPDLIFGTGILDLKRVLDSLKTQGFQGNISIEYEENWDNSVPDVAQCVGFFRGCATCK